MTKYEIIEAQIVSLKLFLEIQETLPADIFELKNLIKTSGTKIGDLLDIGDLIIASRVLLCRTNLAGLRGELLAAAYQRKKFIAEVLASAVTVGDLLSLDDCIAI